jgi:hypothetical protein
MHYLKLGNYGLNFNSDFSGEIIVKLENGEGFVGVREVARLPFFVMAEIVAEKIRRERIAKLEDAKAEEILGL